VLRRTFSAIALAAMLAVAFSDQGIARDDAYLLCEGWISFFTVDHGFTKIDDQKIAVHITQNTISFSGNSRGLPDANLQICKPLPDLPIDELYFRESCERLVGITTHLYGHLNKITGALIYNNTIQWEPHMRSLQGNFICRKADPLF
jgi:hypothetical protein